MALHGHSFAIAGNTTADGWLRQRPGGRPLTLSAISRAKSPRNAPQQSCCQFRRAAGGRFGGILGERTVGHGIAVSPQRRPR
jgi:hypothetical protein